MKEIFKYGREVIKVDEVVSSVRFKEKEFKDVLGIRGSSEGYFVRGRSEYRGFQSGYGKNRSFKLRFKSGERKKVCWICGKEGYYKK